MLRSLFSGVSGLEAHQTMLDVVGNNIANVNTPGFKDSDAEFEDTLSQVIKSAGSPQGAQGGSNPAQVGLGVQVAAVSTNWSQGPTQTTGVDTDLMIQGDGFFVVNDGGQQVYTRNGAFSPDANGNLTTADGAVVQGWTATNGTVNTNGQVGPIKLPLGSSMAPTATTAVGLVGNLPAVTTAGTTIDNQVTGYNAQGIATQYTLQYSYTANATTPGNPGTWALSVIDPSTTPPTTTALGGTTLSFVTAAPTPPATTPAVGTYSGTPNPAVYTTAGGQAINFDLSGVTNFGGQNTVAIGTADGNTMGSLSSYSISPDGTIEGVYSNGMKQPLGQIAMATFNNPQGLAKAGNSDYTESVNSGQAQIGVASTGSRGSLVSGALEGSNVDLSQEFSNLIIAERGFEANSKVITTSDDILQALVQMKQ
jgi:flagellar hook protein FlgE